MVRGLKNHVEKLALGPFFGDTAKLSGRGDGFISYTTGKIT